jgi:hypothetical protein
MKVSYSAPRTLGVDQLVYLSDTAVPTPPTAAAGPRSSMVKLAAVGGVLLAVFGKKKMRTAGLAVTAIAGYMLVRGGISAGG